LIFRYSPEENDVKKVFLAIIMLAATSGCTVSSERTVVEKPVPARPAAVVVPDPPSSTVYVPR